MTTKKQEVVERLKRDFEVCDKHIRCEYRI